MKKLHLLSNAHLDPVWQWAWDEGAAAAISTFRAAANFCEEYDGYLFNHNEVILYQWIEEYEPALFARIQRLVREGKWHIMGGWYLQPDCNMPSGESFVRQMLLGREYFRKKFGVRPTTAINFDSFGHSRGLVQIMQQAGYDSYIFMRPDEFPALPARDFVWEGFGGSRLTAHKIAGSYNSALGKAHEKIGQWLKDNGDEPIGLILWGVGNHGGGPSRLDLDRIGEMMTASADFEIVHSTPEAYFRELPKAKALPSYAGDLNPRFVGCYTSMIHIKQRHRKLENELYLTEKMLAAAELQHGLDYPAEELRAALRDLLMAQFHDILPGTSIQPAEEASLNMLGHGLETVSRLKTRAFFALAAGQPKAQLQEYPVMVYNPHPFPVKGIFECEFMLEDQNWGEGFSNPAVYRDGEPVPCQAEKEESNLNLDWRKRVVFAAELAPTSMNRFDCRIEMLDRKPVPALQAQEGAIRFRTGELQVTVNARTGLIDEFRVRGGDSLLKPGALAALAIRDNEDPWRMDARAFREEIGRFELMDEAEGSAFSGVKETLPSVRVIEDGAVRTVIEAVFRYRDSFLVQTYKLPKQGTEVEIGVRVYWNEKDTMLKLAMPTAFGEGGRFRGQTAFGISELLEDGTEAVAQKWVAVEGGAPNGRRMLTCINDGVYGCDYHGGELRLSLLRSAGYCAHPIGDRPIMAQDRFSPRIDQGEHRFAFWLNAGEAEERAVRIDREATVRNERPYALSFFPSGEGERAGTLLLELDDEAVQVAAFKRAEDGDGYILRLFEPTGQARKTSLSVPLLGLREEIRLNGFEIATFRIDAKAGTLSVSELCEHSTLNEGANQDHGQEKRQRK
ncbi:glycoside hydrolase family 38 C-terminal domain-containing protein [Paenibacillus macerans]|uniref:glycoside hydrolase family 38 N-terminal domain-containing protein n=1 Tax=Paenibacillus macerans TaxID=44252 RepID=UPI003D31F1E5